MATIRIEIPDELKLHLRRYALEHTDAHGRPLTISVAVAKAISDLVGWKAVQEAEARRINDEVAKADEEKTTKPEPPKVGATW